jgi:hypothetical protein
MSSQTVCLYMCVSAHTDPLGVVDAIGRAQSSLKKYARQLRIQAAHSEGVAEPDGMRMA